MKWTILLLLAFCAHLCVCQPLIKVFCSGAPLFRGRVDSIVQPGIVSGHIHKISGASGFSPATTTETPVQVYNDMTASSCTTCSITADLSAYWHPDLYYRWPNGSLSLVPRGGLTIYYFGRKGTGAQASPTWKQFPPGFRMTSGNPYRRTFSGSVADKAISFACLSNPGGPETNDLSLTQTRYCANGLRLQVHFPQCWDGVNLDSANHQDHVAFPIEAPDNGNCPPTHPVRLPDIFFEAFYSVDKFPHGAAPNGDGTQRFVLANGDATGYGFHGDFLNGWKDTFLQQAFDSPTCDHINTNEGNTVQNCAPLAPYVQPVPDPGVCNPSKKIPLTENMGIGNTIGSLPGCNPITGAGVVPTVCSSPTSATEQAPVTVRFHLKSELTGKYWSCPSVVSASSLLVSATDVNSLTYYEVFAAKTITGSLQSILNEGPSNQYLSASGPDNSAITCNKGDASGWEFFTFVDQPNGKVAVIANKNGKYITAKTDGTFVPDTTTIGTAQLFTRVVPNGGAVF